MTAYEIQFVKTHIAEMKELLQNVVPNSVEGYEGSPDLKVYHQVGYLKEGYNSAVDKLVQIEKDVDRMSKALTDLQEKIDVFNV